MANRAKTGFSLLEVLFALLITGILIGVAGVSLVGTLRAQAAAGSLPAAGRLMRTLQCRHYRGEKTDDPAEVRSGWRVASSDRLARAEEEEEWKVWELRSVEQASLGVDFALRAAPE
jgi:prepilin-type N-terminal cleavage/methylation domain-containing protein